MLNYLRYSLRKYALDMYAYWLLSLIRIYQSVYILDYNLMANTYMNCKITKPFFFWEENTSLLNTLLRNKTIFIS